MVDFQSRDTSRGLSSDDDDGDEEEAKEVESAETDTRETPEEDETADAGTGTETETPERAATEAVADTPDVDTDADNGPHDHDGGDNHEDGHSHADHHHGDVEQLGVAVVTVSSSRDLDTDPSGDAIQSLVEDDGHSVVARDLVPDDLDGVQRAVLALTGREDVDVVVTTGGTGVTPDDVTVEAVRPLFDKELPGFGELFRVLSYEEVGTRALGSRATAGVSEGVPVFCLPGSEDAVRTGVEELILAEAPHLVGLARGE